MKSKYGLGVHNCAEGGIGCKREELPTMGAFSELTGGTREQRLYARNYSKTDHASKPDPYPDTTDSNSRRIVFSA
jgi:hypothetical protein